MQNKNRFSLSFHSQYIFIKKKNHIANRSIALSVIPQITDGGGMGGSGKQIKYDILPN